MNARRLRMLVLACVLAGAPVAAHQSSALPAPTRVIRFAPRDQPTNRLKKGECAGSSIAADWRSDAFRCTADDDDAMHDPCFATSRADHVICDVDPRHSENALVLSVASLPSRSTRSASAAGARAWFFELSDGTTCRPMLTPGRVVEGMTELYTCRFNLGSGDFDAVLGDIDANAPVWTIQKVQTSKKVEPHAIKSSTIAAITTVWQ